MSSLQYANYAGAGELLRNKNQYSQTVVVGNIVKCAGQGGWDDQLNIDPTNEVLQADLTFKNVEKALQSVGLRGWEDVYAVRSYHVNALPSITRCIENIQKYMPNHRPIWTCITVPSFVIPEMLIEIEVEAYITNKL